MEPDVKSEIDTLKRDIERFKHQYQAASDAIGDLRSEVDELNRRLKDSK